MWFTIFLIAIVVGIVWFKVTLSRSRKALQDPETFKQYCIKNDYNTHEEQLEFCERMGVAPSVIGKIQHRSQPKKVNTNIALEICFTGFSAQEKEELKNIAQSNHLIVRKDVTKHLNILCCGDNAGPTKLRKASQQNCMILKREEFENMLETGEVPEYV